MRETSSSIHTEDGYHDIPKGLLGSVLARLDAERRYRATRRRLVGVSLGLLVLLGAAIPAWRMFGADIQQSGFMQYLSLLFSDSAAVAVNWRDYSLALVESFPAASAAGILTILLLAIIAARHIALCIRMLLRVSPGSTTSFHPHS